MTKAIILSAGLGSRMRPLTDTLPKPLIPLGGKPLIVHHIEKLARARICDIVVNIAHLGEQIQETLGDGRRWGVQITYSLEPPGGLETGGGIFQALPLLGPDPFYAINADLYTDYDFAHLRLPRGMLGHLVLVPNPQHNPQGDFALYQGTLSTCPPYPYTMAGISIYHPLFFSECRAGKYRTPPLIRAFALQQKISGEVFEGLWIDIGTLDRLEEAQSIVRQKNLSPQGV